MNAILIVTSCPVQRRTLALMLERDGNGVASATSAVQVMEMLESRSIELALVDMAGCGNGLLEIVEHLHAADVPFVALSGSAHAQDRRQALRLGAQLLLALPCTSGELLGAVGQVIACPTEPSTLHFPIREHVLELLERAA